MTRVLWFTRWHIARWMIHTALHIAPHSKAKTLLLAYLNGYGQEIMDAIGIHGSDK